MFCAFILFLIRSLCSILTPPALIVASLFHIDLKTRLNFFRPFTFQDFNVMNMYITVPAYVSLPMLRNPGTTGHACCTAEQTSRTSPDQSSL
jgi:hypothetical protein